MPVVGVCRLRLAKGRDGFVAVAELLANVSQREPCRGKAGCEVGGLQQQVGGGGEIAFQLQIAREIETPVGHQIAGRHEQADGHGLYIVIAGLDPAIHQKRIVPEDGCAGQARA